MMAVSIMWTGNGKQIGIDGALVSTNLITTTCSLETSSSPFLCPFHITFRDFSKAFGQGKKVLLELSCTLKALVFISEK